MKNFSYSAITNFEKSIRFTQVSVTGFFFLYVQLNSCNSNSYNSKPHVIRTDSEVPSEFTLKTLQENSYNSNPCNSKNHVNRTVFPVPSRNFHYVIRIFEFFEFLKLTNSTFSQSKVFNSMFYFTHSRLELVHCFCLSFHF